MLLASSTTWAHEADPPTGDSAPQHAPRARHQEAPAASDSYPGALTAVGAGFVALAAMCEASAAALLTGALVVAVVSPGNALTAPVGGGKTVSGVTGTLLVALPLTAAIAVAGLFTGALGGALLALDALRPRF